jgi:hypothetical protein
MDFLPKKRCTNQWCGKGRVKEAIPLDEFLRIDKLPFKMTVMVMLLRTRFAQAMTYKGSERMLQEVFGMSTADARIEKVTNYVGGGGSV